MITVILAACCGLLLLSLSPAEAAATGAAGSPSSNSAVSLDEPLDSGATDTNVKLAALELQLTQLARAVDLLRSHRLPSVALEKRRSPRLREIHLV